MFVVNISGVYILQKYEFYSLAIFKGTIIPPYAQFPALDNFFLG